MRKIGYFHSQKLMVKYGDLVVLENNNGHLTQLSAERLLLFRVLLPSRQEVLVSCPWAGLGEPGAADEQSVRPSAWSGLGRYALAAKYTRDSSRRGRSARGPSPGCAACARGAGSCAASRNCRDSPGARPSPGGGSGSPTDTGGGVVGGPPALGGCHTTVP